MADSASASGVPAVRNAVAVLRRLAQSASPLPAAALARSLGVPRSTMYDLLGTLVDEGLVTHYGDSRSYGLGVGVFELGSAYLRHEPLENVARPILAELARRTGATSQLGILHGASTLYLLKEQPAGGASLVSDVGIRLPAHLTASGRSLLAGLPSREVLALYSGGPGLESLTGSGPTSLRELRRTLHTDAERGWSIEAGQVTRGITSIAAAARDRTGRPAATVVVSFRDGTVADAGALAADVVAGAARLTARLSR